MERIASRRSTVLAGLPAGAAASLAPGALAAIAPRVAAAPKVAAAAPASVPTPFGNSATFRVRVVGKTVTSWADEKPVGEPNEWPANGPDNLTVAAGAYAPYPVRFSDLKVRKVADAAGPGAR